MVNDLWIAAVAAANGMDIVGQNVDFDAIEAVGGLRSSAFETRWRPRIARARLGHDELVPELVDPAVPAGRLRRLEQPVLHIDELALRPFRLSDAGDVSDAYLDPAIRQWHMRSMSPDEARKWIASSSARWTAETGANWAVVDEEVFVGRVGFRIIAMNEGMAEIAYWTTPIARGRNIAARAVQTVSSWMFTKVGLHRLELNHSIANLASCRVAAKAGFALEGTRRQQVQHLDGWHDMHIHGRLAGDQRTEL